MTTIAFTGHRPKDLPQGMGFQQFAAALDALKLGQRTDVEFVTGGALGTDSWAATYALLHDIPFHLVLPFDPAVMSKFWPEAASEGLKAHIATAASVTVLCPTGYDVAFYQRRNEAMVDRADHVFALWTGKRAGGTANCIRYALKVGKPIHNLFPLEGKLRPVKEA